MSKWKELLFRINSIPSVINFLLNLGCSILGYLSIQNEIAFIPNSWDILLYKFILSNVTMRVLKSILGVWSLKIVYCPLYSFLFHLGIVVVKYLSLLCVCWAWQASYYRSKFEVIRGWNSYIFRFLCFDCFYFFKFVYFRKSIKVACLGDIIC